MDQDLKNFFNSLTKDRIKGEIEQWTISSISMKVNFL